MDKNNRKWAFIGILLISLGFMISAADECGELSSLVIEGLSRISLGDRLGIMRYTHSVPKFDNYSSTLNLRNMI